MVKAINVPTLIAPFKVLFWTDGSWASVMDLSQGEDLVEYT